MPDAPAPTTAAIANSGAPDSWRDRDCAMSSATRPTQSTTKIPSRPDRHEIRELCGSGTSNSVKGERPLDERPIEGEAEAETIQGWATAGALGCGRDGLLWQRKRGKKNAAHSVTPRGRQSVMTSTPWSEIRSTSDLPTQGVPDQVLGVELE